MGFLFFADVQSQANMAAHMVRRLFCCRAQLISQYMKQPPHRVLIIDNKNSLQWTIGYSSRGRNYMQVRFLTSTNTFAYRQALVMVFNVMLLKDILRVLLLFFRIPKCRFHWVNARKQNLY